ncbi:MAG: AarF/ABC1/UbiB kinase family protein, partial [Synechococcales cyanobacterium T60_A2020_003]|nr:AarF/ABC1/UbiB kinase family protein [Synechococcales cyanobacterium T60_A2020_003]
MRRLLSGSNADEPELPTPAVLRNILTDLGPVYIKLGQLLSTRPDLLPADYITALSALQSNVPPEDAAEMEGFIRQNLPAPPDELFTEISYVPVAAGSIAQTHKAVLRDGRSVALKVQRPRLESVVAQDIEIIKYVAKLISGTSFGQRYNIVDLADGFSRALQAELDFTKEAQYTERLRANLATSKWFDPNQLVVPGIHWDLTSKKMLVMDWLEGKPILTAEFLGNGYDGDTMAERKAISTLLFRAFFQQYLIEGFFHADPHPGNVFYLNDGRVAL